LPAIADDKKYALYNYAPQTASLALKLPPETPVVFTLEGPNFSRSSELTNPAAPFQAQFEPGEMKVFFAVPRKPQGIDVAADIHNGTLSITASLKRLSMPWPLVVTITDPAGNELYRLQRSMNLTGKFHESLSLGMNAAGGEYLVKLTSPVGNLSAETKVAHKPGMRLPRPATPVRVFDAERIKDFLLSKPELVLATNSETSPDIVRTLTDRLGIAGVKVTTKPEAEVLRKVTYPRVWNPYAKRFAVSAKQEPLAVKFDHEITLGVSTDGTFTAQTADGKDVSADWRQPNSRITIAGEGFVDFSGDVEQCYEPGVQLHINEQRQLTVLNADAQEVKTSSEFRARWAKPWSKLTQHVGAYQLPAQLPEAYTTDSHLLVLGSSQSSSTVAVLQASELLPQIADEKYPGPSGALVSLCWSPFAVEKNAIVVAGTDAAGLKAGIEELTKLLK
jgi:hypothetical protein